MANQVARHIFIPMCLASSKDQKRINITLMILLWFVGFTGNLPILFACCSILWLVHWGYAHRCRVIIVWYSSRAISSPTCVRHSIRIDTYRNHKFMLISIHQMYPFINKILGGPWVYSICICVFVDSGSLMTPHLAVANDIPTKCRTHRLLLTISVD